MRPILFVHIPRTGGTTVEALMRKHLSGRFSRSYWEGTLLARRRKDLLESDYFIGHNFYYVRDILPAAHTFTFLRDPVERLYSLWVFMLEHNPDLAARFDDFMDCARRNPHFSNHQTRFLAGRYDARTARARVKTRDLGKARMLREVRSLRSKPVTRVDLEIAKEVLFELDFVGIFEDFEASVVELFDGWGIDVETPLPYERKSVLSKSEAIHVTEADREELEALNQFDRELYELALRRHRRRGDRVAGLASADDDLGEEEGPPGAEEAEEEEEEEEDQGAPGA